jgi:pimeloyl-ACP methyl ester carboxylesterase
LGWERFALIGHSRGAMIAFLAAGTLPERISHLVLIEGGLPRTATAEQAPEVLADSLRALRLATARARQFYPGFAEAVAARQQGLFPLTESDALLLARHGVVETDRGFHWSYDPKLMAGSEVRFSIEQVEAFRRRLTAPTQVILGLQGFIAQEPEALAWLARSPEWQQVWLPGDHHLHMHAQCDAVASAIRRHLNIPDDEEGLV